MKKNILAYLTISLIILKLIVILGNETGPFIVNDEYIYKKSSELLFYFNKYKNFHYPPVYSIFLLPAFLFSNWYKAILCINVILSTLLVPGVWFLAVSIGVRKPILSALLAAIIPFHIVYPNYILSENIFVPLFVLCFAMAMRGDKSSVVESCFFGGTLALTHLTKYMFLPAVPVLFGVWVLKKAFTSDKKYKSRIILECFLALFVYALLMTLWVSYGKKSGASIVELFGLNISTVGRLITDTSRTINKIQASAQINVGVWAILYVCFLLLKWNVLLGFVGMWASQKKSFIKTLNTDSKFFLASSILLVCGYVLMAIIHSVGAKYNFNGPTKIMGRYLVHLGPVLLVLFTLALEGFSLDLQRINIKRYALGAVALLSLGGFCWWILVDDGIWEIPSFFYKHEINLSDVTFFGLGGYMAATLLVVVSPLIYKQLSSKNEWILMLPLVLYFFSMSLGFLQNMPFHNEPVCIKKVLETIAGKGFDKSDIYLVAENIHISEKQLLGAYDFWNIKINHRINLIRGKVSDYSEISSSPLLVVTHKNYNFLELNSYEYKNRNFKIYQIN